MTPPSAKMLPDLLRRAFSYWEAKRGPRPMPARRDLQPEEMGAWLSSTFLLNVEARGQNFRFRLAGTDVVRRYGREITGMSLDDLITGSRAPSILAQYQKCVTECCPTYAVDDYPLPHGHTLQLERLLMPLSDDGTHVNMIFGVLTSAGLPNRESGIHGL